MVHWERPQKPRAPAEGVYRPRALSSEVQMTAKRSSLTSRSSLPGPRGPHLRHGHREVDLKAAESLGRAGGEGASPAPRFVVPLWVTVQHGGLNER